MTTRSRYTAAITDKPWWLAGGIPPGACVAAYQAKGASSLAGSYINLANPGTYNMTEAVEAMPWSSGVGWDGDNTNYLLTGLAPSAIVSTNANLSMIVKCSNIVYNNSIDALVYSMDASQSKRFGFRAYTGRRLYFYNGTYNVSVYTHQPETEVNTGVLAIAGYDCYINGLLVNTMTASVDVPDIEIKTHFYPSMVSEAEIQALSIYKVKINSYQVAALTNAMNAL